MELPADLAFSDWVIHIFDHPVTKRAWHRGGEAPEWDSGRNPSLTVAYLTALFRAPDVHLARFTPAQINQGLWYLVGPSCSDYAFSVKDPAVPLGERTACLRSVFDLYARCFARLCSHHYGHLDDGPELPSPVNSICYMFWDIFPIHPRSPRESEHAALEEACLEAMERILELAHPACQEGALHGLGHFAYGYEERVQAAVDAFIREAGSDLLPELRAYALSARRGCVL